MKDPGTLSDPGHGLPPSSRAVDNELRRRLSRIRHELRTPTNHILGYTEMLQEEQLLPGDFRADLERIHQGGVRLLALINEYFSEEKFTEGNWDLRRAFHELRTPVNQIVGYSEMLQERAHELDRNEVLADLRKIRQAALNWLALMERELVPSVTTAVSVPASPAETPKAVIDTIRGGWQSPAPHARPSPHAPEASLLVVDDDPVNRELLVRRLQRHGYRLAAAADGEAALKALTAEPFDLVLLDMLMPGLDGFQVLSRMKADETLRHVPVIMISALDDEDGIVRCIELGAEDYLAKPFNPVFLRARIGAALEKKHLRDQERYYLKWIEEEQEKSQNLLLNVLPKAIAERLKQGESTIVDRFAEATVLFADIVGFTSLSVHISPTEMVRLLDEVFSMFDLLVEKGGLEKIKTIGDAYMAVAGLPTSRADHAEAAARLALEMEAALDRFNAEYGTSHKIRIGIHLGPVVAGIIGRNKFIYDLWGDTVNTASRMESHGVPGRIQVTEAVYERLKDAFVFEERGRIEIKGKGEMTTWFLLGPRQG